jgi:hypothetical protein
LPNIHLRLAILQKYRYQIELTRRNQVVDGMPSPKIFGYSSVSKQLHRTERMKTNPPQRILLFAREKRFWTEFDVTFRKTIADNFHLAACVCFWGFGPVTCGEGP